MKTKNCKYCGKELFQKEKENNRDFKRRITCGKSCSQRYSKSNVSSETRLKISNSKKGGVSWNKGIKHSDETRRKISEKARGRTGRIHSSETIEKIRLANTGNKNNLGKHHSSETRKKIGDAQKLEKHWNWKGGSSKKGYTVEWKNTLKISIRERDRYRCQLCGEPQGDRAHSVHHIDYNKANCDPNNLITLCTSCHMKTNHNRECWTNYFST